jgi:DNA-binding NarL/FixJ family response regulator
MVLRHRLYYSFITSEKIIRRGFGVREQLMTIRVLLADDHVVVRRLLRGLIEDGSGCAVCGEAADGAEAVRLAEDLIPDVVVLDISMPKMDGLEAARRIRVRSPATPVLMITMDDTEQSVRLALAAGARGYIVKGEAGEHLKAAVLLLAQTCQPYFTPQLTAAMWTAHMSGQLP